MMRRLVTVLAAAGVMVAAAAPHVRAQEVISKEAATELKASFVRDLDTLRGKFVGLAEAFPQDKYTWRPMEGVRSVSEVLMLANKSPAEAGHTGISRSPAEASDRSPPSSSIARTR
jgi:hypothetical protein